MSVVHVAARWKKKKALQADSGGKSPSPYPQPPEGRAGDSGSANPISGAGGMWQSTFLSTVRKSMKINSLVEDWKKGGTILRGGGGGGGDGFGGHSGSLNDPRKTLLLVNSGIEEAKHLKDQRSTPAQPARRQSPSPGHSQRTARGAERSMDRRSTPAQPAQPARRQSPSPGYSQRTARGAERSMDQRMPGGRWKAVAQCLVGSEPSHLSGGHGDSSPLSPTSAQKRRSSSVNSLLLQKKLHITVALAQEAAK
ncbi:hypothetical protein ACOMHN_042904 [Nucella lapillus]